MSAEAQGVADGWVGSPTGEMVDDGVVRAQAAERPSDQLGGEGGVASLDPALPQELRQDQVGVGVVLADRHQHVVRRQPRGVDFGLSGRLPGQPAHPRNSRTSFLGADGEPRVGDHLGQLLAGQLPESGQLHQHGVEAR